MKTHYQSLLRVLFLFILTCPWTSYSQTLDPKEVTIATGISANKAYSPSITSLASTPGQPSLLVSAYAYTDNSTRKVAVSKSTNSGSTWSFITNLAPPHWDNGTSSASELKNLDDPQIITLSYNSAIALVVRAWSDDESLMEGESYLEQPKSIYRKSGIYITISTNGGQTWGYYDANNTWQQDKWGKVAETGYTGSSSPITTLENPRIAYRYQFDGEKGYIVWEKKTYSKVNNEYRVDVTNTDIGIAAFGGWETSVPYGKLINLSSGGNPNYYIPIDKSELNNRAPERPSVAIAPDKTIWVSFHTIDYPSSGSGTSNPGLHIWITKGYATSTSGSTLSYSFNTSDPQEVDASHSKTAIGKYDPSRGYIYPGSPDPEDLDFGIDLTQGPSIQVVYNAVSNEDCNNYYWVGVAYPYGYYNSFFPDYPNHSKIAFIPLTAKFASTSTSLTSDIITWKTPNRTVYESDKRQEEHVANMQFFPVLKYTTQSYWNEEDDEYFSGLNEWKQMSYFVIAFMGAERVSPQDHPENPKCFKYCACMTGISFDNENFQVTKYSSPQSYIGLITRAEYYDESLAGWVNPKTGYWGSKIDVCGDISNFEVHPIWHQIQISSNPDLENVNEKLLTNIGNGILIKTYLEGFPSNDKTALQTGGLFKTNFDGSVYYWGDYEYFGFNGINRPTSITPLSQLTVLPYSTFSPISDFLPNVGTASPFPYGMRVMNYRRQNADDVGLLGNSNQRKFVVTGRNLHTVYERDGNTYYNAQSYYTAYQGVDLLFTSGHGSGNGPWNQEIKLSSTNTTGLRPSIAVYQQGDGLEFSGEAAIAITWVEKTNDAITIKLKTREYNLATCLYGPWSQDYIIHSHSIVNGIDDNTTSVVAPHVTLKPNPPLGLRYPTNLLGWTVTWNCPRLSALLPNPCDCPKQTGLYSRTWLRVLNGQTTVNSTNGGWATILATPASPAYALNGVGLQPNTAISMLNTLIEPAPCNSQNPIGFPSVTSTENRQHQNDLDINYSQEVAFSNEGITNGIWVLNPQYSRTGSLIGSITNAPLTTTSIGNFSNPVIRFDGCPSGGYDGKERNPSITVNSSGQRLVAWEGMVQNFFAPPSKGFFNTSTINIRNSFYSAGGALGPWKQGKKLVVKKTYADFANNMQWEWQLNPSITAFPKTKLQNDPVISQNDFDLGITELLSWKKNDYNKTTNLKTLVNQLKSANFVEPKIKPGFGVWPAKLALNGNGRNSQRSFGTYNVTSHGYGNEVNDDLAFVHPFDSYFFDRAFKGTYDSTLGVEHYRQEEAVKDSGTSRFVWGSVYVGDTLSSLPMRQVKLSLGLDSLYSSTDACRDSLFRSEVFDFPPGAEISYYRGQFFNDSLCYQPGGVFFNPTLSMKYRVELVHSTGAIDTIEEFEFAPFYNKFIYPKKVHIMNGSLISRDVYLRVKGTLAGLIDPDSLVDHADLSSTTAYPYDVDTTIIAYKSAGSPDIARLANGLNIQQPYPNPLQSNMSTFSLYVAYPKDGTIHLSLFNTIGQLLDKSIEINSTGEWQRVVLPAPKATGTYYLHVHSGRDHKVLPVTVIK